MSPAKDNPCLEGLTADCFKHNPKWAKQAFAYRLLHTITPKKLTRRLPKGLRLALVAPGVMIPPGVILPPGTTVPPGTIIPPGWAPADPVPPGITIPPGTSFPEDWTASDPPPDGVILQPGAEFPEDWSPADPLPPGSQPPPATPPETEPGGVVPPTYVPPWEPGPVHPPSSQPAPSIDYWFYEPFDDLATNSWTDISHSGGTAAIAAAQLKLKATAPGAYSAVQRTHATAWPTNWTLEFSLNYYSGTGVAQIELYTGTYRVRIYFTPPTTVNILPQSGACQATVANYLNQVNTWKLVVTGGTATLYQNNTPVITTCTLFSFAFFAGRMEIEASNALEAYFDYMTIVQN